MIDDLKLTCATVAAASPSVPPSPSLPSPSAPPAVDPATPPVSALTGRATLTRRAALTGGATFTGGATLALHTAVAWTPTMIVALMHETFDTASR